MIQKFILKILRNNAAFGEAFDSCIECGFCERVCPSRGLTFTPRQRIKMLKSIKNDIRSNTNKELLYKLVDTCAVDGLCQTACPVSINTGDMVKDLRNRLHSNTETKIAGMVADNFSIAQTGSKAGLSIGHCIETISWTNTTLQLGHVAEYLTGKTLPKWNHFLPKASFYDSIVHKIPDFVYFPCCISRIMGQPAEGYEKSLIETIASIAEKANFKLLIHEKANDLCCGNAFLSKGYFDAYAKSLSKLIDYLYDWSDGGRIPIVFDSSSCTYSIRNAGKYIPEESLEKYKKLNVLDIIEFLHDYALPNLSTKAIDKSIALHPNCSVRKMGLQSKFEEIARKFTKNIVVPDNLDCCGFAGDRGLLFPELSNSATKAEAQEIKNTEADLHYSSNIPCEVAMADATKENYLSIAYLVDQYSVKF
jgi:D-lactate dehydrogenase